MGSFLQTERNAMIRVILLTIRHDSTVSKLDRATSWLTQVPPRMRNISRLLNQPRIMRPKYSVFHHLLLIALKVDTFWSCLTYVNLDYKTTMLKRCEGI